MNMSKLENVTITSVIPDNDYISLNGNQYRMNPNLKKLFIGKSPLLQELDVVDAVLTDDIIKSLHKKSGSGSVSLETNTKKEAIGERKFTEDVSDRMHSLKLSLQLVCADPKTLEKDDDSFTVMRVVKIAQFFDKYLCGSTPGELENIASKLEA